VGINPGGIAEMYVGYPQPGCKPDEEYAVIRGRKGFVRMAIKYGANLVPVFVFGGSKFFKRLADVLCLHICIYIYICICICMFIYICMYIFTCAYIY
jgi:hypothetical protein